MPVIPWKVRRRTQELVTETNQENRHLRHCLRTAQLDTLKEVYGLLDECASVDEVRHEVVRRIRRVTGRSIAHGEE